MLRKADETAEIGIQCCDTDNEKAEGGHSVALDSKLLRQGRKRDYNSNEQNE